MIKVFRMRLCGVSFVLLESFEETEELQRKHSLSSPRSLILGNRGRIIRILILQRARAALKLTTPY